MHMYDRTKKIDWKIGKVYRKMHLNFFFLDKKQIFKIAIEELYSIMIIDYIATTKLVALNFYALTEIGNFIKQDSFANQYNF